ncbi:diadenosine tetraphosphate (Ap4A) HIT family hydrolase [Brevibacillus sp. AG162]|uniref:HIT family protein n=1 Tax=Brevibacillus sp. AG162 TaxID=2572910 RepID=UPI0011523663|nr:HIT family protein [Brevibacillus sp. AG162]TQK73434.1 diadenosine tetraphosphate (Ap4A) HIT family hydrolase [Brevibacillus sp. AG162]
MNPQKADCLGCRLAHGIEEAHIVFENEWVACLLDIDPFSEGHALVLPKQHLVDWIDLDEQTMQKVCEVVTSLSHALAKLYKPDGITICQNGGAFNDLTHFHVHVIPRFHHDGFGWSDPLYEHGAANRLAATRKKVAEALNDFLGDTAVNTKKETENDQSEQR